MKKKNQKGAITLFILIALLFFIIVLINLYIVTANRANKQVETTKQTVDIYGKNIDQIEDLYKSYFGDGNVIPIYTAEQLQQLVGLTTGQTKNVTINEAGGKIYKFSLDKVYLLRNDIDASIVGEWTAIGTQANPFNGILEGANHTITGINITGSNKGLFENVGENAEIRNLKITGEGIKLATNKDESAKIINCYDDTNSTVRIYTITYKDVGDTAFTGAHELGYPTSHTYGTATSLAGASKEGYTFEGWFTSSDGTGTAVTSLGATDYTANVTLYAKWENWRIGMRNWSAPKMF